MRAPRLTFRNAAIAAALTEAGLLLGLVIYLAVSGRALVVSLPSREERWRVPASAGLVIPVAGVRAAELRNTYGDARSGGQLHHLAVDDRHVIKALCPGHGSPPHRRAIGHSLP